MRAAVPGRDPNETINGNRNHERYMQNMRKIYTKTGDHGTTGISQGIRVPKDDIRIEANGTLDELNALLGIIRTMMPVDDPRDTQLRDVQRWMMAVMSHVATPERYRDQNSTPIPMGMTQACEIWMDQIMGTMQENDYFILPGGNPLSAHLQYARTVARRAERRLWSLDAQDSVPTEILHFVNRLSDLLFVMARQEMQQSGCDEERWRKFRQK